MNMLTEAISNASAFIQEEAATILGCDPIDAAEVSAEATPAQRVALEFLTGINNLGPSAVEMLDLADDTLGRVSRGRIESSRLARWEASLGVCPLPRGSSPAAGSLSLPALDGALPANRRDLNLAIRALGRLVWGAAFLRSPSDAVACERTYGLGDLAPIFGDVLRAGHDDLYHARRVAQLVECVEAFNAQGRAHKGSAIITDLGLTR
jgi:hypothetical protein